MNKRYVLSSMMLMAVAVCILVVILHYAGYDFRVVRSNQTVGIPSSDGRYYLVELSDSTERYLMYSVIQLGNQGPDCPKTVFVTDDFWYYSSFAKGYGWIEGTSDFYIDSSDSGRHRYLFDGTTWVPAN